MKTQIIICIIFSLKIISISSQKKMQYYEDFISKKCANCSNADLNEFLIKETKLIDSLIEIKIQKFNGKIESKIQNSEDNYSRSLVKIKEEFSFCYENWIKTRELSSSSYAKIMQGGTSSFLYFGFMYLMISDEILEFINCYDTLTFG